MAYQLVYTSAAKLLDAGRSGFGTVARSKSISSLVVSAIERASQFANLRGLDRSRVIHVHRRITAGSSRFHVLTRIVDAGVDYTGRTNHIAHHLVVSQEEANKAATRGVTPADVLRQFPWLDRWDGSARYFDASEDVPLDVFRPDGKNGRAQYWTSVTGNPSHARLLAWDGSPRTGVMIVPDGANPLSLMAEALAECGAQSWTRSFTTSLETTDELADLDWIVSTPHTYQDIQPRCGNRTLWDLTAPATLPVPPAPTLPAPQQTTQRKSQETMAQSTVPRPSGVHSRSPDIAPVKMRSAESETWTEDAPRRATRSQQSNKKSPLMLAGACVALVAALIVVGMVTKSRKEEANVKEVSKSKEESNDIADAKERIVAVEHLKQAGIDEQDAEIIFKAVKPNDCIYYKELVDILIKATTASSPEKWENLESYVKLDNTKIDWFSALVSSCKEMHEYQKMDKNTQFVEKIKKLDSIYDQLKFVANSKKLYRLKQENCEVFVQSMIECEIIDLQKNNQKFEASIVDAVEYEKSKKTPTSLVKNAIKELIDRETLNEKKNILLEVFRKIEDNANNATKEVITSNPEITPTDAQKNQNQIPPQPAKKTLDTSGLKQFEITLLKEQNKLGEVKSAILGLVLKDEQALQSPTFSLAIKIDDDSPIEKKSLTKQQGGFYSDHYAEPKIKLYEKGKIEVTNPKWKTIEIDLKHENISFRHFIVVSKQETKDDKKPVITEELVFDISEVSPDEVKITCQAFEFLIGNNIEDGQLKFYHLGKMIEKGYLNSISEPKLKNGELVMSRSPQQPQDIILDERDSENLSQLLKKWEKENKNDELRKIYIQTINSLKESIGYCYLIKYDEKFSREKLNEQESVKKIIDHFKLKKDIDKNMILKEIGESKIKNAYSNIMKSDKDANGKNLYRKWEEMENPDNGYTTKLDSIKEFLNLTKKRKPPENYKSILLNKLNQITVKTEYRVLFTAKLKQP